jgi:hypothetical protein
MQLINGYPKGAAILSPPPRRDETPNLHPEQKNPNGTGLVSQHNPHKDGSRRRTDEDHHVWASAHSQHKRQDGYRCTEILPQVWETEKENSHVVRAENQYCHEELLLSLKTAEHALRD